MKTQVLSLDIISPFQELKEVTINSNFNVIDALMFKAVSCFVESDDEVQEGELAIRISDQLLVHKCNGLLRIIQPSKGHYCYLISEGRIVHFDGVLWV